MYQYIFGWIATSLSGLYRIPQIIKLYNNKNTDGLSSVSYIIQTSSYSFYILHGVIVEDYPIVTMGCIAISQNLIILYLYYYFHKEIDENIEEV